MDASQLLTKVKEGATRKIGPLPAWAWGVVTAGGIWIYRGFTGRIGGGSSSSSSGSTTDVGAGYSVIPSLSGGGAPPPTPGFGSPEGSQSSMYISTEDFSIEGDPTSVTSVIDRLIAGMRNPITTGGGGTPMVQPDPSGSPVNNVQQVSAPSTVQTPRYTPLSASSIRALFRDFPGAFSGNPDYWVNGFQGTGTPGVTAARPEEWSDFWAAYSRAGSPS